MTTRRKRVVAVGVGVGIACLLLLGLSLAISSPAARLVGPLRPLGLDVAEPDGLIDTESLGALPRDVLAVPLFRDVLTEDLVTYYEQHPGRLTLGGILRRLAWEHDADLGDWAIRTVLDEPAQVALWRGGDGRIRHWLIVIRRNTVTRLMDTAARLALKDRYLAEVSGGIPVGGGVVPAYALQRSSRQTLLFAAHGDRLVIASDAGLVLDADGKVSAGARPVLEALLGEASTGYYHARLGLEPGGPRHRVVVSARYLSFGYQRFFPGVQALRFDFGPEGWATRVRFDRHALPAGRFEPSALWRLTPVAPSACFALPVDWAAAATLAASLEVDESAVVSTAGALAGPVAVCWYPASRLHTPVFVAPLTRALAPDETIALERLFVTTIGRGDAEAPIVPRVDPDDRHVWQRRVAYRLHRAAPAEAFQATLAQDRSVLVFSPDARLVDDVLGVADKRYPAVADVLPARSTVLAVVAAPSLARLLRTEVAGVPGGHEPAFRTAAATHLAPRLAALERYPTYALVLPATTSPAEWARVEWVELARP